MGERCTKEEGGRGRQAGLGKNRRKKSASKKSKKKKIYVLCMLLYVCVLTMGRSVNGSRGNSHCCSLVCSEW